MLTPRLQALKAILEQKGYSARSPIQDEILEELDTLDRAVDTDPAQKRMIEGYRQKTAGRTSVHGPSTDTCPSCGRSW